jgi:hypothetical protein
MSATVEVRKGRYTIFIEKGSTLTYELSKALGLGTITPVDILYSRPVLYTKNKKGQDDMPYLSINNNQSRLPISIGDNVSKHIGVIEA